MAQEQIAYKILHFGGFKETLNSVVDLMRSEYPSSVIIRGNPGSGKRSVIREARKITGVHCIYIDPFQCAQDQTAIKRIAQSLDLDAKLNMTDLMERVRMKAKKDKLVIVLEDFPEFCRNRQSLLYNLMNLLHSCSISKVDIGPNITLIGLTINIEWAENIEKRVMSRLNAKCLELSYPYRTFDEYVQFTSQLLDGHKISKDSPIREQLSYMYHFNNQSVRFLKFYLMSICDLDKKGRLTVNFDPEQYKEDYNRNLNIFSKERLKCLTRSQLDILKMAVYQYHDENKHDVSIASLTEFSRRRNWQKLDVDSMDTQIYKDVASLVTLGLILPQKPDLAIGQDSAFYPQLTPIEIKAVITMDSSLRNMRTDSIWKKAK